MGRVRVREGHELNTAGCEWNSLLVMVVALAVFIRRRRASPSRRSASRQNRQQPAIDAHQPSASAEHRP